MIEDIERTMPPSGGQHAFLKELEFEAEKTIMPLRERKNNGRFEVGTLVMGRYKVLSELGQGGMGVVYKCFDETAGIEIALKALPPELSHNAVEMEDIRDNFQLVAKLVHQNIAISKNLEKNPENGDYYLIMECCEGEDLRHWIRRKRKENSLTPESVLPVIKQVADALDYAHGKLVMHRDIKPGNIIISTEGVVKILDFGLAAQILTSMSRVDTAFCDTSGTGPYMAPEQWKGYPQGAAADQYALAVMTYEMLAGHLPFENTDPAILREAVLNGTPQDVPGVPETVQAAIRRAMSKEPEKRFPCCRDFVIAMSAKELSPAGSKPLPVSARSISSGKNPLLTRASLFLESGNFDMARTYCERVLDQEPECGEAYYIRLLAEWKLKTSEELVKMQNLRQNQTFLFAQRFADPELRETLDNILAMQDWIAEEKRLAEEKRKEEARLKHQQRMEEEKRLAEEKRQAEQKRKEEARLKYQQRMEEERRREEEKRLEEQKRREEARLKYQQRMEEERRREEEKRLAEQKRREEARLKNQQRMEQEQSSELNAEGKQKVRRFLPWTIAAIILLLLAGGAVGGWFYFTNQTDEIDSEEPENDKEQIRELAEKGKALYDKGQYAEAVKLLSEAAEKGDALAQTYLGLCYDWGRGVDEDLAKAAELYRKAAKQGEMYAQRNLGLCYQYGRGVEKNLAEAVQWYRKAAEQGQASAQCNLGLCYERGQGVEKDYYEAVKWYRKAAEQGNMYAQHNLGVCYEHGWGVEKNLAEAVQWYRKAAEQGHASAQNNLGACYKNGQGVEKDYYEAVKWFRKAAEQGEIYAQNNLGLCYERGQGVEKDYYEAVKWYRKAAEQGYASAQNSLGVCYERGQGVEKDLAKAVEWYRKAAEQGEMYAQNNLGWCYKNGQGVERDYYEAVKWYRKAAEQGHMYAQNDLGVCYQFGQGVERDYYEAVKWYRKAAAQGHASAQNNLGACYEYGQGVKKDLREAVKWYMMAAEQGNAKAKENLRRLENSISN